MEEGQNVGKNGPPLLNALLITLKIDIFINIDDISLGCALCIDYLQQLVVSLGWDEEPSVLQMHLSVLQEVIEYRQHISFCLFNTLQHQYPSLHRRPHCTLQPQYIIRFSAHFFRLNLEFCIYQTQFHHLLN